MRRGLVERCSRAVRARAAGLSSTVRRRSTDIRRAPSTRSLSGPLDRRELQNRLDAQPLPRDARAVSVEVIGQLVREGGAVALALVVYSELRLMRQTLATLAERMTP